MFIDAYCTLGESRDEKLAPEDLLHQMERCGVATAVIAPGSRELAVANREGNARITGISKQYAGKFIPAFTANPWFGDESLDIANEAAEAGGQMLVLAPHLQGHHMGNELGDALVDWACERNIPIYAHASPTASGTPSQLFFLAERFPKARFLLGRGGTTDYAYDMLPILRAARSNIWFDLGFVRPSAFSLYADIAPARICFASCSPQNDMAYELKLLREALPEKQFSGIYGTNFKAFLHGDH